MASVTEYTIPRSGTDRLLAVGDWVERWMRWCVCAAVLRPDVKPYVHMRFLRCTEQEAYGKYLSLIVRNDSKLADDATITHGIEYVCIPAPFSFGPTF